MKHVRTFEKFRITKNREEIIKESVLQVNDIYKVRTMIDIPQSLINSYVKKVKDLTGKNLRQYFGDVDIAEEIVKWVNLNFINIDKIPGGALLGGQTQAQGQGQAQEEFDAPQDDVQTQEDGQAQVQVDGQTQAEFDADGFEDPQAQVQTQGQAQMQGQGQAQMQGQSQGQGQAQDNDELPL